MPCNSSYMEPNNIELKMSVVASLLDELETGTLDKENYGGYHPEIYRAFLSEIDRDAMVAKLCSKLQKTDVTKYSLEMQTWWRDHQKADKERIQKEIQSKKDKKAKAEALKKLTPYERELLGL